MPVAAAAVGRDRPVPGGALLRAWLLGPRLVAMVVAGCGGGAKSASTATLPPTTVLPTTAPPATTALQVSGVGPIPLQPPFYPQVTVTAVSCGDAPGGGRFVRIDLPAGQPGTPAGSVLVDQSSVMVVPGKAVLLDHTGKVVYEEDRASIATARQGAMIVSLTNVTGRGGDGRTVESGAIDISGDYGCPAADQIFPGS
jgi:hypothetical protein